MSTTQTAVAYDVVILGAGYAGVIAALRLYPIAKESVRPQNIEA